MYLVPNDLKQQWPIASVSERGVKKDSKITMDFSLGLVYSMW